MAKGGNPLRKKKHASAEDNEVDMTPMIDCIMLLLIFFMTTSKMSAAGAVAVPEAKHGGAIDPRKAMVVSLFEGRAGKPTDVVLGDGPADGDNRKAAQNEEEIRQFIAAGRQQDLKTQVIVKAEEHVPARDVNRISKIVGEFENLSLFLGIQENLAAAGK
jgi:biopolymer transport protein ExbD